MKANLNTYIDNNDKLKPYLAHCYKDGIDILPPSVNLSKQQFTVQGKEEGIRYGLRGLNKIKSLSNLIFDEREARDEFKSFQDFVERMVAYQKLNKAQMESLIFAGALDEFEGSRRAKISMIETMMDLAKSSKKSMQSGQITLFDFAEENGLEEIADMKNIKTPEMDEFEKDFLLAKEKEYAGSYITGHPLDDFQDFLKEQKIIDIATLKNSAQIESELEEYVAVEEEEETKIKEVITDEEEMFGEADTEHSYIGEVVSTSGIITEVTPRYQKDGKLFMTFTIEDRTGEMGAVCFAKKTAKNQAKILVGKKVVIKGDFDVSDFGPQIKVDTVFDLEHDIDFGSLLTVVGSKDTELARNQWRKVESLLKKSEYNGSTKVVFVKDGKKFLMKNGVNLNLFTLSKLQSIFGKENCIPNNEPKIS